jgi:hypothetical protein
MKLFGYDLGYNNSLKDKMYWLVTGFMTRNGFMLWGGDPEPQKTTTGIDPSMRPYVERGLSEAQKLYETYTPKYFEGQTYVSPSAQTESALKMAEANVGATTPVIGELLGQQRNVLGGQYLGPNPYLEAALKPAQDLAAKQYYDAINQTRSNLSGSGRLGSGAQVQLEGLAGENLANALVNQAGNAAYQNYATERGLQESTARYIPQLLQSTYAPSSQLLNVGQAREDYSNKALQSDIDRFNFQQNLPYQRLAQFTSTVAGQPLTTTSTTSGGGKIVCTAMNAEYGFGSFRNAIWLAQSKDLDPAYEKGYHTLFLPLVNYAYKAGEKNALQRILRGVLEHIARHRTADIWKQKRGKTRDNIGMIYRAILEPICYVVGKVGR